MPEWGEDEQERILRVYTVLRLLREDWRGALILCVGLGQLGRSVAMASNIAGAVCLSLEKRPERLKAALHAGCCDFIVNTLDEALRVMKNEVRKRQPISVGLEGDPLLVLEECLERGVQPEILIDLGEEEGSTFPLQALQQFRLQGAMLVSLYESISEEGAVDAAALLNRFVEECQWQLSSYTMQSAAERRAFDTRALLLLNEEDMLRCHWLRSASRIVQRDRPLRRTLWLTTAEAAALEAKSGKTPLKP